MTKPSSNLPPVIGGYRRSPKNMRSLIIVYCLFHCGLAGEVNLSSTKEKTFTTDGGQAFGDIHQIVFTWKISTEGASENRREFAVIASRRLHLDREDLRYWKAQIHPVKKEDTKWNDEARLTRDEFVSIVSQSERELRKQNADFHFKYVYVDFHSVSEHEADISPRLRKVLANAKGEVQMKHRGIMLQFLRSFAQSPSIADTSRALQKSGLDFPSGRMGGDYYTPVDPEVAATWKDASKLNGFGLRFPPTIVFTRNEGEQDGGGQPSTRPKSK
jgi:hypothetical protein